MISALFGPEDASNVLFWWALTPRTRVTRRVPCHVENAQGPSTQALVQVTTACAVSTDALYAAVPLLMGLAAVTYRMLAPRMRHYATARRKWVDVSILAIIAGVLMLAHTSFILMLAVRHALSFVLGSNHSTLKEKARSTRGR